MAPVRGLKSNCCLQFYVNGDSVQSQRAIENLSRLCRDVLPGSYDVSIVDVLDAPDDAERSRIMWTPTLIKTFPRPVRRVVGDLSDFRSVLNALDLPPTLLSLNKVAEERAATMHTELLLGSPDGMLVLDALGNVLFANQAARTLLDWPAPELTGWKMGLPWMDDDSNVFRLPLPGDRTAEGRASVVEWQGRCCQLICLRDMTTHVRAEAQTSSLITELIASNERLGRDATLDPLTRVLNRRGLEDVLVAESGRCRRTGEPLAALLIDCDDFKAINDTFGHAVGDQVLRTVAQTAVGTLRPQDSLGRIGGDEFMVLLPSTQLAAAVLVGERILAELKSRPASPALQDRSVTVSIGASSVPPGIDSVEAVVDCSSKALRLAKQHGKHRVVIARGEAVEDWSVTRLRSATERLLLDPSQLRTVRLDIFDLCSELACGSELLVRGPHGSLEQPRSLFDVARNLGLEEELDMHCLRANLLAGKQLPGVRRHINVLPTTLLHQSERDLVALGLADAEGGSLCLEINEQEIVGDPSALRAACSTLQRHGVVIALDNVCFARSALEAMVVLQPNIVKIGVSLVSRVSEDHGRARDLRRLIAVANRLGAEVIAQGIETRDDVAALLSMGVVNGQGFLWGQPEALGQALDVSASLPSSSEA